jgi:hypothetical protein
MPHCKKLKRLNCPKFCSRLRSKEFETPDTCSRSTAWAARFRPRRSARCCRKRSGRQIGDHLKKPFADFGISCLLSGLGALLGIAQVLGGFRTHGVACVDVHSGTSHMYGRCLTLTHSMPWFGHSVQNRHAARDVYDCDVAYQQRRLRSELASGRVSIPPHLLNSAQDLLELSPYRVVNAAELIRSAEPSSLRPLPKWSRGRMGLNWGTRYAVECFLRTFAPRGVRRCNDQTVRMPDGSPLKHFRVR